MNRFESAWWTIELAPGWSAEEEEHGVTITRPGGAGALQISAAWKEAGLVTREDLLDLTDSIPTGTPLHETEVGAFSGLEAEYVDEGRAWRMWWLRSANLMIYASYSCALSKQGVDDGHVFAMLSTFQPASWLA